MSSSEMLRRVVLVRTDVSEEHIASIIRVSRISELRTLAGTNNLSKLRRNNVVPRLAILVTLMMEVIRSSETSALLYF
jgi:hypothetical protein